MEHRSELLKVLEAFKDLNTLITDTLTSQENNLLRIQLKSSTEASINRLRFLSGDTAEVGKTETVLFPPITSFMGEKIEAVKPVTNVELNVKQHEKNIILEKIEQLQKSLPDLDNKKVLELFPLKTDQIVLRGLAKRAGVEDYKTAEIDETFVQNIRLAFDAKEKAAELDLKNQQIKVSEAANDFEDENDDQ